MRHRRKWFKSTWNFFRLVILRHTENLKRSGFKIRDQSLKLILGGLNHILTQKTPEPTLKVG